MEFGFTDQQEQLRDVAREFLADRYPVHRVAALADSPAGYAEDGWAPIVAMGWLDPELTLVERALLAEESGYALHPVPWWTSLSLAVPGTAPTTFACYDEQCAALETAHRSSGCRAAATANGWRVTGAKRLVPDLAGATDVVLTAETGDGVALFRVRRAHRDVTVVPRAGLDGLRRMADLRCNGAPGELIGAVADTPRAVRQLRWRAMTLLAAEAVGVARRAYHLAGEHAKVRRQFGRPIGAYQGVAFRVADSYVAIELAHSLVHRAAWSAEHADDATAGAVTAAVSCAVLAARDAALAACEHAIQVLGGTGMTWEHPVHRWYRRALWTAAFDTSSARHREDLARLLLGT